MHRRFNKRHGNSRLRIKGHELRARVYQDEHELFTKWASNHGHSVSSILRALVLEWLESTEKNKLKLMERE